MTLDDQLRNPVPSEPYCSRTPAWTRTASQAIWAPTIHDCFGTRRESARTCVRLVPAVTLARTLPTRSFFLTAASTMWRALRGSGAAASPRGMGV